jgi:hypothetical protein
MVAHYVKDANKKQQSSAAILKLENTRGTSNAKHARGKVPDKARR